MKKRSIIITIVVVLLVFGIGIGAWIGSIYNKTNYYVNLILPGVKVQEIDLSGKTKEEAVSALKEKYGNAVLKKKINIKTQGKTYSIDYTKLNARYNIEDTVNEAYSYGRDLGTFSKYNLIKKAEGKQLSLKFTYDSKPIKDTIAIIQKDNDKGAVNATITMVDRGKFSVTPEKNGAKLNADKLEKDILNEISGELKGDVDIQAEVDTIKAAVSAEQLSKINTRIASYTTNFASSSENRAANITLATKSINGKIIMPGESFSFNDVVGERTPAKGYKDAPVIIGNQVDSGIGGGICQVSSTLYNAVVRANIKATERTHHTLPSSYVGLGMDATVDWGNLDYKFKNTLDFPIYLEGYADNRNLYFNIYSDSTLSSNTYDLYNEIYETIQPNTKYIDDPNLEEGQQEIVQKAYIGYKVKVYKRNYQNGTVVSQELISNDYYKQVDGVIKRGTKKK